MRGGRQTILAGVTAAVVLGAGILALVVEPRLKERKARTARIQQLQAKLARLQADLRVRSRIDQMYEQIGPLIRSTGNDQQEMSAFTRELSDLYAHLNVKMRSVKLLPTVKEEFYRRLSVKIEMQGRVQDVVRFVLLIEAHASPLRIEQFGLKARETADEVHASLLVTKVVAESGS